MYSNSLIDELKKVLGWKDFWDLTEIPTLGSPLNDTETGEYYQDFNGAVRLDYIASLIAGNRTLTTYLDTVQEEAIPQLLRRIEREKKIGNVGKDIANSNVIFDVGRKTTSITNEGRFTGVMFELNDGIGLSAIINRIGLYLTANVTDLDIYVFHSSQEQKVTSFGFTTAKANSFSWQEQRIEMDYDTNSTGITGGTWYVGYYQDDLAAQTSQAVQYSAMNWLHGYCNSCNRNNWDTSYKSIQKRLSMTGFYVPAASLPVSQDEAFDPATAVKTNSNNWGLNFNITVGCNMTQFWTDNRRTLADVIGLAVSMKVLEMMKFSSQINNVEESVKIMIIRDLEGATDTENPPLHERLSDAIEALVLDEGNLNIDCLPCARKPRTTYGAIG
jgi:hypothetical protein